MTITNAILEVSKTVATDFQHFPWSINSADETKTVGVNVDGDASYTVDLIAETAERTVEIAAKLIETLVASDLCAFAELADLSSAKTEYRYGTSIRDSNGIPLGYRMHFSLEVVRQTQPEAMFEAA